MPGYEVQIAKEASDQLRRIGKKYGAKTYRVLRDLILGLGTDPDKKGEALTATLKGFHSLHCSRFRIIYKIHGGRLIVLVVAAGWHESGSRSDVYQQFQRALDSGRVIVQTYADD